MSDGNEQAGESQSFVKGIVKGFFYSSPFDPDMTEKKAEDIAGVSTKQVLDHITGKDKMTPKEIEEVKRSFKYMP
ncbi:hypothetical protein [Paenibacillus sp. sgz500958]|uniref:hypothetical protein n=1 Tax=Paenibacillus sp. sgz500958 TaxID=3242475 RepID=UPI0036D4035E